jgi:hypothetical protein
MSEDTNQSTVAHKAKAPRKAKGKAAVEPKGKRSLNLSLPVEDYERLAIHALRENITISDLVSRLARDHCRDYHITRTARAADNAE